MRFKIFLVFVSFLFFVNLISASFSVGNLSHSIETRYGPGANIQGWINISAENQGSNSLIKDSLGKSIKLKKLLDLNSADYNCFPKDCSHDYFGENPETAKIFNLMIGTSQIFGLKLQGDISTINSIDFKISSDDKASCSSQLLIDVFADGIIDFANNKSTSNLCSKTYGCFDSKETSSYYNLGNTKYCQKIKLSPAPGYKIGSWIKKVSGSRNITMELYSFDESNLIFKESCKINGEGISLSGEEKSCDLKYSSPLPKEVYVCMFSNEGNGIYQIKGYSDENGCGYYGNDLPEETKVAYNIFAQGKKFADFGSLDITNNFDEAQNLALLAEEYINEKYGSLDCSDSCIIPIKITSNIFSKEQELQKVTLSDLQLSYSAMDGEKSTSDFYKLTESPAKISFDFQKLWLDNSEFFVSSDYGESSYVLKLGSEEIFSEEINIEELPIIQRLFPKMTVSAYPTEFEVKLDSYNNISKYEWDFGNGDFLITKNNTVIYTYNKTGFYNLKVTITTEDDFSTYKVFNLTVGSPREIIKISLEKFKTNLENLKEDFKEYSSFTSQSLEEFFNLKEKETIIKQLEADFEIAEKEQELNTILSELLTLDIPKSISTTGETTSSLMYYPQKENVNLYLIEKITGEESSENNENIVNAIFVWNQKNLVSKIGFTEISAIYSDFEEPILKIFTLNIDKKNNFKGEAYLIFDDLENLNFDKDYSQKEEDCVYIDLKDIDKVVVFSTTEDVSFSDLPVFISPAFSQLALKVSAICGDEICESSENYENCPEDCEKNQDYTLYILIIAFLILLAIIVYVFMQIWYRKKYEGHLFKNKNDLLNIMHYVSSSKKKGLSKSEIEKNLRESKWKNEQVNYAMKKYSGKRTGMAEIPIDKLIKKISLKKSQRESK